MSEEADPQMLTVMEDGKEWMFHPSNKRTGSVASGRSVWDLLHLFILWSSLNSMTLSYEKCQLESPSPWLSGFSDTVLVRVLRAISSHDTHVFHRNEKATDDEKDYLELPQVPSSEPLYGCLPTIPPARYIDDILHLHINLDHKQEGLAQNFGKHGFGRVCRLECMLAGNIERALHHCHTAPPHSRHNSRVVLAL